MKRIFFALLFSAFTLVSFAEEITLSRIKIQSFQDADVEKGDIIKVTAKGNGKRGSGINFGIPNAVSGAYYRLSCEVRGSGNLEGMCYTKLLPRKNLKIMKLTDQWQKIEFPVILPIGEKQYLTFVRSEKNNI